MTTPCMSLSDYNNMHDKAKRLLTALSDTRNRITELTGENGMSPLHRDWIQGLFLIVEMESLWRETEE